MKLGEARHDENGKTRGGKPGNQTTQELAIRDITDSEKFTTVLRAKDDALRKKLAKQMKEACANMHIGYAQYKAAGDTNRYADRYGLWYAMQGVPAMKDVYIDCNCDCSSLVADILIMCSVNVTRFMSTSDERKVILQTGRFDELKYKKTELKAGDILWRTGHTAIVTDDDGGYSPWMLYEVTYEEMFRVGYGHAAHCNIDADDGRGVRCWAYVGEVLPVIDMRGGDAVVEVNGKEHIWQPILPAACLRKI